MKTIKAIETTYKGYRFRSRLEARWAVFFDTLGIKWEYEKEGFDLGDGVRYLPDFWLPQVSSWAEVKPDHFTGEEFDKCFRLAEQSEFSVILLDTSAPENRPYFEICEYDYGREWIDIYGDFKKNPSGVCPSVCLTMYHGYPVDEGRFYGCPGGMDDGKWDDTEEAANAARAARFEYK